MREAFCLSDGWLGLATDFVIFSLLALSAWLVLRGGRISLGQQAYFALGAYAAALGTVGAGWSLLPALALGAAVGALAAGLFAWILARLSGLHYAVATLAIAELVRLALSAWQWRWTDAQGQWQGPNGIDGFREIRWLQQQRVSAEDYLWLALAVLAAWHCGRCSRAPAGPSCFAPVAMTMPWRPPARSRPGPCGCLPARWRVCWRAWAAACLRIA